MTVAAPTPERGSVEAAQRTRAVATAMAAELSGRWPRAGTMMRGGGEGTEGKRRADERGRRAREERRGVGRRSEELSKRKAHETTAAGKGSGGDGGRAWLSRTGTGGTSQARDVPPQVPRPCRGRRGHPAPHPLWRQPSTGMRHVTRGPSQSPPRGGNGAPRGFIPPGPPVAPPPPPPLAGTRPHRAAPHPSRPPPIPRCGCNSAFLTGARRAGRSPVQATPYPPQRRTPPPSSHPTHSLSVPSPIFPSLSRQHQPHLKVLPPGWKPATTATAVRRRLLGAHHGDGGGQWRTKGEGGWAEGAGTVRSNSAHGCGRERDREGEG